MSRRSCCVPRCAVVKTDGVPLHLFPNPEIYADKFKSWVINIGSDIERLDHHSIYLNRRVCHRHFEEVYKYPTGRLSKLAIPTLHIPDGQAESLGGEAVVVSTSDISQRYQLQESELNTSGTIMSEGGVVNVKHRMLELFSEMDENDIETIEQWICNHSFRKDLERLKELKNAEQALVKIGNSIKKVVPFEAEMPSETIKPPTVGDQADCNNINTCHVDEFLYDDNAVDNLVKKGKLKKHYCRNCNSRDIKDLIYISHSMSRQALQYIFKVLLPSDLEEKQILDVGSRLGAVLYGAYHFSNAGTIIGIEMNEECCDVQKRIIEQHTMDSNRIKVVHSDVLERSDLVANSDIIVINILEFFVDNEKHKEMWHFFKKYIKKGSYLVCNRSMVDTLVNLDIYEEFINWLSVCKPNQLENEIYFDIEDYHDLYLYTIN